MLDDESAAAEKSRQGTRRCCFGIDGRERRGAARTGTRRVRGLSPRYGARLLVVPSTLVTTQPEEPESQDKSQVGISKRAT
jgi:hypothetical protein